ncbi:MAG: hypothetical protein LUQ50_12220 [Methanospirillum sp.]|uniref:hypothetical protein n=1 Tax=Methanospirillum sp. TaxID=45200 RepID=UPI00236A7D71|nr:hypothetical protein [Methanospirillum sp.]MDD1729822.1 hypothetical protein [Methanospirillum sp.]
MRFREVSGASAKPGTIEVHIIRPGRGSSGYYFEETLKKAAESGVYPKGMLMHWDHPTRQQEEDQPARVTGTIAAVLAEQGHYLEDGDPAAWDGPGVYALAEVRPKFTEDLKWMAGKIGVSHYVDGLSKEGEGPDGKSGRIITELLPSPFNSVDFVTIPGAGGHSRFNEAAERVKKEAEMAPDKQLSIRLSEIMTSDPEVVKEIRKQVAEELQIESQSEAQKQKVTEAETRIKTLETENKDLKAKIAEKAAREYVTEEIGKTNLPESARKTLTESLIKQAVLAEDGSIDAVKFGLIISEAIKAKQTEIADILKESGISGVHDNGSAPSGNQVEAKKAREDYRDTLIENGMTKEIANRLAGIEVA